MQKAKLFNNGGSQVVRLPKEFRFEGEEVAIRRIGKAVVLLPADRAWDTLYDALEQFTPDFMADCKNQSETQEREDPVAH